MYSKFRQMTFAKMGKIVERAVIQYLHKKGLAHKDMVAILGNHAPSYGMLMLLYICKRH